MSWIETTKKCRFCDKVFEPIRDWQRFCSDSCRKKYWKELHKDSSNITKKLERLEQEIEQLKRGK